MPLSKQAMQYGQRIAAAMFHNRKGHGGGPCHRRVMSPAHLAALAGTAFDDGRKAPLELGYSRPVEKPHSMRRGLMNAVQMAINAAERGDSRECVLQLVNLLDDLGSNSNPYQLNGKA